MSIVRPSDHVLLSIFMYQYTEELDGSNAY